MEGGKDSAGSIPFSSGSGSAAPQPFRLSSRCIVLAELDAEVGIICGTGDCDPWLRSFMETDRSGEEGEEVWWPVCARSFVFL